VRGHLRTVFAKREDPYAGVDLENASRIGGAVWLTGALITVLVMPLAPPDYAIGDAGWLVAGAIVVGALVCGVYMFRAGASADCTRLYAMSFLGLAAVASMVWLSGGAYSPYAHLFLFNLLYTAAIHPPRRFAAYMLVFIPVTMLPLLYDDWSTNGTVAFVTGLAVWTVLAVLMAYLMSVVRAQRLGLRREGEAAREQARLDKLTSLLNRRAFDEDLSRAVDRARQMNEPLSVLVGDLNDFKDFNDRFGHLEGDRVLKAVAASIKSALRRPDVAYRWGGDEFAVILPQADYHGAEMVAERVTAAVQRNGGPDGDELRMSTGVAELESDDSIEDLLDRADQELFRAKGSREVQLPQTRR
jgi:diguanylate cyclase (GGDEF)-like protein